MVGWNILLRRLTDEAMVRRALADFQSYPKKWERFDKNLLADRLAVWQAGPFGLAWIEQAASVGGGVTLSRNGYPNWYLVRAADVLPTILTRTPDKSPMYEYPKWIVSEGDVVLPGWRGKTTIDDEALKRCDPNEWLLVEAWDES